MTSFTAFIFSGGITFAGLALRRFEFVVLCPAAGGWISAEALEAFDGAAAVFTQDGDRVSLLQAAGDAAGLGALAAELRSRGTISALNFPAGGPVATALREAGAEVRLRQYEMVLPL